MADCPDCIYKWYIDWGYDTTHVVLCPKHLEEELARERLDKSIRGRAKRIARLAKVLEKAHREKDSTTGEPPRASET